MVPSFALKDVALCEIAEGSWRTFPILSEGVEHQRVEILSRNRRCDTTRL
jgi:hypothetical protein